MSYDLNDVFGATPFDTNAYEQPDFDPVPPGDYPVTIQQAEIKQTKAGDGCYLEVVLLIVGDKYAGRKIWDRFNIKNPSEKAEAIGRGQLAGLGKAVGIQTLSSINELVQKTVIASLKVEDKYNAVRKYASLPVGQAAEAPSFGSVGGSQNHAVPPAAPDQRNQPATQTPFVPAPAVPATGLPAAGGVPWGNPQ